MYDCCKMYLNSRSKYGRLWHSLVAAVHDKHWPQWTKLMYVCHCGCKHRRLSCKPGVFGWVPTEMGPR